VVVSAGANNTIETIVVNLYFEELDLEKTVW